MTPEQVNERIAAAVARFVGMGYTLDEITIQRDAQVGPYTVEFMVTAGGGEITTSIREWEVHEPDVETDIGHA